MTDKTTNPLEALKIDTTAAPEVAPLGPPSLPYDPAADHVESPEGVRVAHVQPVPFGGVVEYLA